MEENRRKQRVELLSSDGEVIIIDRKIANRFARIRDFLGANDCLYVPNIRSFILRKVLTWSFYHKNDPGLKSDSESTWWYTEFFNVDQTILLELMETADFLDMRSLFNVAQGLRRNE
ncbi:E3 ubiquitin ligase complex SCF subunit sconC-like [Drosophila pseudoobscura]|uniref:E3 ubiquitin ligase complex SCF subunit sconC-like n=1 Tax=Drosophila pseudoobscura pseudoobscura TaxID=46245 RepID=A0A6I8W8H0_DROPS|nr:E3 ubiquitin ligase complex SCF subunit sconC-like [Drosophila pseudoobscura]